MLDFSFYNKKRVFVTGHTGFKGSWLCKILTNANAIVTGYSLEPTAPINLFNQSGLSSQMKSVIGDIRDFNHLHDIFKKAEPEIVFHLAAQPIVRDGYKDPKYTYETNVMGTVNILECVRSSPAVKSVLNITTDKVYRNNEWCWGYREEDVLDGYDPYSNSKSCSELITHSYKNSFFADRDVAISTVRAGNVIGGGDFAKDRIIPDCIRAVSEGKPINVRNPNSVRPYQHVLEPLAVYLSIVQRQYIDKNYQGYYNVGPDDCDCVTTGELVNLFCQYWGENAKWECLEEQNAPHEADFLKLDCSKLKSVFGWRPRWHIEKCMEMTVRFSKVLLAGDNISDEMDKEIKNFMEK